MSNHEDDTNSFLNKRSFMPNHCFVCDELLTKENSTEEHIYPKWLQRKFNLYNQKISLLNETFINYRNLKVPCCKCCNQKMSKAIEKPMERAVNGGYEEIINLNRKIVFQWLNKISYGMLYKETMLLREQRNKESGAIIPQELLNELHMKYIFLISIIKNTDYIDDPFSLLVFKLRPDEKTPYWGFDSFFTPVFCMRMNNIGIIAHLQDNRFNEDFFIEDKKMKDLLKTELHTIQFLEVCARFFYKSSLFIRNPGYIMVMDNDNIPKHIISQGMSGIGYNDWNQKEYAKVLSFFWKDYGIDFQDIYKGEEKVWTLLWDETGSFIELKDT